MGNYNEVEILIQNQMWEKAKHLIEKRLKNEPNNHWLLTSLSTVYYQLYDYEKALDLSIEALDLEPNCPLVNWDYALALQVNNEREEAISIWKKLVERDINDIAYGVCGEGLRWAKSLKNDCRYKIAETYYNIGEYLLANKFIDDHLKNRARGLPSDFTKKHVLKVFDLIQDEL